MRKIERLKREALESCRFREHVMNRFKGFNGKMGIYAYSQCKVCRRDIFIDSNPLFNGIEIAGEAVALHCRGGG